MSILPHFYNDKQITQTSEDTVLAGKFIPKGYCNATEICKVNNKRWVKYMEFSKTPAFLKALNEVSPLEGLTHIITITDGANELRGTWVSLPIAMNLAQWCSPEFAAWAAIVLSAIVEGQYKALTEEAENAQAKLKDLWQEVRRYGIATRRLLTDAIKRLVCSQP